jgi:hypothetical protein
MFTWFLLSIRFTENRIRPYIFRAQSLGPKYLERTWEFKSPDIQLFNYILCWYRVRIWRLEPGM